MKTIALAGIAVAVLAGFLGFFALNGGGEAEHVSAEHHRADVVAWLPTPAVFDYDEQLALEQDRQAVAAYLAALERERLAREAAEREAAEAAARAAAAARPRATVGSTVGACTGFVIPDYIIQRESGGNPSAYNPSGAYGCAQTLLSHYSSGGTCAGLNPYTIEGQRECVYRLSSGGTNLSPWRATA